MRIYLASCCQQTTQTLTATFIIRKLSQVPMFINDLFSHGILYNW